MRKSLLLLPHKFNSRSGEALSGSELTVMIKCSEIHPMVQAGLDGCKCKARFMFFGKGIRGIEKELTGQRKERINSE